MKLSFLRHPIVMLFTIPSAIALGIGSLSPVMFALGSALHRRGLDGWLPDLSSGIAVSILSVIATASMTALSLAFSLVLVVFTLAAGNIGPRLLNRFATDPVNQITAGIFGGAFIFALLSLLQIGTASHHATAVLAGIGIAVLSVLQLIFFVRNVAGNISIDREVAKIGENAVRLARALADRRASVEAHSGEHDFDVDIEADRPGYVSEIALDDLLGIATERDLVIRIDQAQGTYVLPGQALMSVGGDIPEEAHAKLRDRIALRSSRSEDGSLEFQLNLLVEIALRALSPGVNDTFTALAVVDSLSRVFNEVAALDIRETALCDEDGHVRVIMPSVALKRWTGAAFHPLRRASSGNILMAQGLARAYSRLYLAGEADMKALMKDHVGLLMADLDRGDWLADDVDSVRKCLAGDLAEGQKK